jgi:hypothetical protein
MPIPIWRTNPDIYLADHLAASETLEDFTKRGPSVEYLEHLMFWLNLEADKHAWKASGYRPELFAADPGNGFAWHKYWPPAVSVSIEPTYVPGALDVDHQPGGQYELAGSFPLNAEFWQFFREVFGFIQETQRVGSWMAYSIGSGTWGPRTNWPWPASFWDEPASANVLGDPPDGNGSGLIWLKPDVNDVVNTGKIQYPSVADQYPYSNQDFPDLELTGSYSFGCGWSKRVRASLVPPGGGSTRGNLPADWPNLTEIQLYYYTNQHDPQGPRWSNTVAWTYQDNGAPGCAGPPPVSFPDVTYYWPTWNPDGLDDGVMRTGVGNSCCAYNQNDITTPADDFDILAGQVDAAFSAAKWGNLTSGLGQSFVSTFARINAQAIGAFPLFPPIPDFAHTINIVKEYTAWGAAYPIRGGVAPGHAFTLEQIHGHLDGILDRKWYTDHLPEQPPEYAGFDFFGDPVLPYYEREFAETWEGSGTIKAAYLDEADVREDGQAADFWYTEKFKAAFEAAAVTFGTFTHPTWGRSGTPGVGALPATGTPGNNFETEIDFEALQSLTPTGTRATHLCVVFIPDDLPPAADVAPAFAGDWSDLHVRSPDGHPDCNSQIVHVDRISYNGTSTWKPRQENLGAPPPGGDPPRNWQDWSGNYYWLPLLAGGQPTRVGNPFFV